MKKSIVILLVFIGILGVFTGMYLYSVIDAFQEKVLDRPMVEKELQVKFFSQAVKMNGTQRLQFASLKQIEVFEKKSMAKLKWVNLNLPDVVVGAVIPVKYSYYVELNDEWKMDIKNNVLTVYAPKVHFNEPAADISHMELMVTQGSIFRNEQKVLDGLKSKITELLRERAGDNVKIIKEAGRKEIESFITKWIVNHYQVKKPDKVIILFKDEEEKKL